MPNMRRLILFTLCLWLVACQTSGNTPSLTLVKPSEDIFTNQSVAIEVEVSGTPDTLELFTNDTRLTTLESPYTYTWDTDTVDEGVYTLEARGIFAGETVKSEARKVTVDRTAPTIVSRTPASDADNIAADAMVEVTFSEPVLASGGLDNAVVLTNSRGQTLATTPLLDKTTLTVQLDEAVTAPTTLSLELSGLSDLAGNALAGTSWSWSVPSSAPSSFELLGPSSPLTDPKLAERPAKIAADAEGHMAVAWLDEGAMFVKARAGDTWQALGAGFTPTRKVFTHSLALLPDGNPVLAWQEGTETTSPQGDINVDVWNGSAWESLGGVDTAGRDAAAPSVAVDNDGTIFVAWFEFTGTGSSEKSNVYVKRWNGSSWETLGDALDTSLSKNAAYPSLALDAEGTPFVAWYEDNTDNLGRRIYVKFWNGSSWEQLGDTLNVDPGERADMLSLAVGGNGRPVVAWSEFDQVGGSNNLYVKRWTGSSWQQLGELVDNLESNRAVYPDVAVDSANRITVVWYEARIEDPPPSVENDDVYFAQWTGSSWEQFGAMDVNVELEAYYPDVALVGSEQAPVMAWFEGSGGSYQVYVKQAN
jgi:hypothetical protein